MAELSLSTAGLQDRAAWEEKGYQLPQYDRAAMIERTKANPEWIHFGAGNIFKAFQCRCVQGLLNEGVVDTGIVAVERTKKGEDTHDGLAVVVTLKSDGTVDKEVVGSIAETVYLYGSEDRMKEIFANPSLKMASFTITEKGYAITDTKGELTEDIKADIEAGPDGAKTYMGKVAALLLARYNAGELPIAMVSMDNCSHNGDKLKTAISTVVNGWSEKGLVPAGFEDYILGGEKVSFPWTMIDKITPSPDLSVGAILEEDGLHGFAPVRNARGTVTAPFVNAEETEYLVIEDSFPNGRLPWEKAGFYFTDRETVDKVERMKVTTCLNPLHTTLAVYGCLLGYKRICEEMKDPELTDMIKRIGYVEGMPVVTDPGILNPKEFIDAVINVRLPNPFMPDAPQRIATDTSQKVPVRFGETIKGYIKNGLDLANLKLIPLVYAGWLRYLMGVDDEGNEMPLSPDPLLDTLCPMLAGAKLGEDFDAKAVLEPILSNDKIFGVNLCEIGLEDKICGYFKELCAGPGAVRATLKKYVHD